jgi:hypothetical protein
MQRTHHAATFIVLALDGDDILLGLSENAATAVGNFADKRDSVENILSYEAKLSADRPLVVVIGKNKTRATAGEKDLESFARDIVRTSIEELPADLHIEVAGQSREIANAYYAPRVESLPLPWATKSTPAKARVRSLLDSLSFTDEGLDLIPKGLTYVGTE